MLSAFPVAHVDVFTRVNLQAGVIRQDGNRDPVFGWDNSAMSWGSIGSPNV